MSVFFDQFHLIQLRKKINICAECGGVVAIHPLSDKLVVCENNHIHYKRNYKIEYLKEKGLCEI